MRRIFLLIAYLAVATVWAQDPAEESAPDSAAEVEAKEQDEEEDFDIDSQEGYAEEDEGDFKPTDDVSYEQSVQFPVDI